jgi:hypothetical protein
VIAGKLLRESLRVEAGRVRGARPFGVTELVVYPTARPDERITIPIMPLDERMALDAAVAGILCWREDPRIGPALAG